MTELPHAPTPDQGSHQLAQRLADVLVNIPSRVAEVEDRLGSLNEQMAQQARSLNQLAQAEEERNRLLQDTLERQQWLESASRQQELLSETHYQQHVVDPLARQVFPLLDDLHGVLEEGRVEASTQTFLAGMKAQLLDLLATHGIEAFSSFPGDPFDPSSMRPVKKVRVFQLCEDRTVSRVLKTGFRRGSAFLRHQSIEVCVYRPPNPTPTGLLATDKGN